MEEKLNHETSSPVAVGVIRFDGSLETREDKDISVKLSHKQSKFTSGELPCIMGELYLLETGHSMYCTLDLCRPPRILEFSIRKGDHQRFKTKRLLYYVFCG